MEMYADAADALMVGNAMYLSNADGFYDEEGSEWPCRAVKYEVADRLVSYVELNSESEWEGSLLWGGIYAFDREVGRRAARFANRIETWVPSVAGRHAPAWKGL
jgi:hypothetical protein